MLKRIVIAASIVVALLIVAGVAVGLSYQNFLATPLTVPQEGVELSIPSGTAFSTVAERLERDGIVSNAK